MSVEGPAPAKFARIIVVGNEKGGSGKSTVAMHIAIALATAGQRVRSILGERLHELSQRLHFRCVEGLAERVIFREFYPRGLTAMDDLDELTLGTRPTLSHLSARLEMEGLLAAMGLGDLLQGARGFNRDAA